MSALGLEGRGVIVVGAGGGGIGTAIARMLAVEGALVTSLSTASADDPVFPYLVEVLAASPSLSQD